MTAVRGRPVNFGIQLQAQRTSWAEYAAAVRNVEQLGFGSIWTFDHMLPFSGEDDGACFETLTTLSAMALLTDKARIGVLVNGVLYRGPATLAKAAAQVDEMSGGRLEFSLGAAWAAREFTAYGLPFPPLSERYGRLDEALQVVKMLWTEPRSTFDGRWYRLQSAPCEPKPLQRPHPPITIGGAGRGSLKIAAKHADRLNIIGSPDECARRIAALEELCKEVGRDFDEIEISVHPTLVVADAPQEARAKARAMAPSDPAEAEQVMSRWLIGDAQEVAGQIRAYLDLGVSHFVFALGQPFDLEPFRLFQQQVVPLV